MTAVEQLMIELYEKGHLRGDGSKLDELLEKYKEMEKDQVLNAFKNGQKIAEQYYKETYNI